MLRYGGGIGGMSRRHTENAAIQSLCVPIHSKNCVHINRRRSFRIFLLIVVTVTFIEKIGVVI